MKNIILNKEAYAFDGHLKQKRICKLKEKKLSVLQKSSTFTTKNATKAVELKQNNRKKKTKANKDNLKKDACKDYFYFIPSH